MTARKQLLEPPDTTQQMVSAGTIARTHGFRICDAVERPVVDPV